LEYGDNWTKDEVIATGIGCTDFAVVGREQLPWHLEDTTYTSGVGE
jgi:hypothetical protein